MTRLLDDLARICREQALERARRSRSRADQKHAALPCRVLAVTPCGEDAPQLEVVGEAPNYGDAIAAGCAHIFARSRFDDAAAIVLVVEGVGRARQDEPTPEPSAPVALAVAITLENHPHIRAAIVHALTLELLDASDTMTGGTVAEILEKAATSAETFRALRRSLGADAEG